MLSWTARRFPIAWIAALVVLVAGPGCRISGGGRNAVSVYAAASLTDVLRGVAPACEESAGSRIIFNFAASSILARQIVAAGRADLFISADVYWMEHVAERGLVLEGTRRAFLSNSLVVIAPDDSGLTLDSAQGLTHVRRLALANPEAVPAGKYAKSWLQAAGVWDRIADRVVPAVDVRGALALVESDLADAGVVYRTDALLSHSVRVIHEVPREDGPSIRYEIAQVASSPDVSPEAARVVLDCFAGESSRPTFERFGFTRLTVPNA